MRPLSGYFVCVRCRSSRSWRTGLLGVAQWQGVGVHLLGTLSVARSTVLTVAEGKTRPNMALSLRYWLAPSLSFENSIGQKPFTALYEGVLISP
jgi:hypothetical protein